MGATLSLHERFGEELFDDIEFPLDEFATDASIASPRRPRHPSGVKWGSVIIEHDADDDDDRARSGWVSRASVARMWAEAVTPSAPREAFRPRLLLKDSLTTLPPERPSLITPPQSPERARDDDPLGWSASFAKLPPVKLVDDRERAPAWGSAKQRGASMSSTSTTSTSDSERELRRKRVEASARRRARRPPSPDDDYRLGFESEEEALESDTEASDWKYGHRRGHATPRKDDVASLARNALFARSPLFGGDGDGAA